MSFPELSVIPLSSNVDQSSVAKQYSRTKLLLGIASSLSSFVIVLVILASGVSREASDWASSVSANDNVALLLFLLAIVVIESIVTLPLGFYSGYVIEHKYNLSNQTPGKWGWEKLKGLLVGGPLVAILALVLWYCLKAYGNAWWLPVSIVPRADRPNVHYAPLLYIHATTRGFAQRPHHRALQRRRCTHQRDLLI